MVLMVTVEFVQSFVRSIESVEATVRRGCQWQVRNKKRAVFEEG